MSILEQTARMAPSVAQRFAALGLTCTTVAEAAQAIEDLSALARTEAAMKAGAIAERDAALALIAEVVACDAQRISARGKSAVLAPLSADLWDRLVAAARTTEGQ